MTPFEQAQAVYEREECAHTFAEDLMFYLERGYIWSSPGAFGMARPVALDLSGHHDTANRRDIVGHVSFSHAINCWHVHLCAGDWRELLAKMPFRLPYISFERDNNFRYYPLNLISKHARPTKTQRLDLAA